MAAEGNRRLILLSLASHLSLIIAFLFQCDGIEVVRCAIDDLRSSVGLPGDPIGIGSKAGLLFFGPVFIFWLALKQFGPPQRSGQK